jgi:hypothetical protein
LGRVAAAMMLGATAAPVSASAPSPNVLLEIVISASSCF